MRAADDGFFIIAHARSLPRRSSLQIGWFRWEAYVVWLSGMALIVLRYFWQADLYLIDPARLPLTRHGRRSRWSSFLSSPGSPTISSQGEDRMERDDAPHRDLPLLAACAFAATQAFSAAAPSSSRGAIVGTIMAANVAHVLVPNQRRMLAAARGQRGAGRGALRPPRASAPCNNYLVLPVLFLMLSVHYPLAFAGRWNWLVAILALVVGAAIRHFFVARHRGEGNPGGHGPSPSGGLAMAALSYAGARTDYARARTCDAMAAIFSVTAPRFRMSGCGLRPLRVSCGTARLAGTGSRRRAASGRR